MPPSPARSLANGAKGGNANSGERLYPPLRRPHCLRRRSCGLAREGQAALDRNAEVDSGGIGILVGILVSAKNHGGELKLVSPSKHVNEVLRRTNMDTVFKVCGSGAEAVAAFRKQVA
jgi:STAS domain